MSKDWADWTQLGINAAIGAAVELAVIYLIARLFVDQHHGSPLFVTLIGFALLYAFRLINWLISIAVATVMYYVTKRSRISAIVALMYQNKVPVNDATRLASGDELFEAIARSEDSSPQAKRFALLTLGELSGIRLCNRYLALMQTAIIIQEAWDRYRSEVQAQARAA